MSDALAIESSLRLPHHPCGHPRARAVARGEATADGHRGGESASCLGTTIGTLGQNRAFPTNHVSAMVDRGFETGGSTMYTRRGFVSALAGTALGTFATGKATEVQAHSSASLQNLAERILKLFETLPGKRSLLIVSPAIHGRDFRVLLNADSQLFCGSAFKVFVLAEFLRMVDGGE